MIKEDNCIEKYVPLLKNIMEQAPVTIEAIVSVIQEKSGKVLSKINL